jgi:hypothetical protein
MSWLVVTAREQRGRGDVIHSADLQKKKRKKKN